MSKERFSEKFDYIIFYGVLEHMYNIKAFLQSIRSILKEEGRILLGVPNCTNQILNGDISMLFLEHWSYFTEDSLKYTVNKNGLSGDVSTSSRGGYFLPA